MKRYLKLIDDCVFMQSPFKQPAEAHSTEHLQESIITGSCVGFSYYCSV